MPIKRGGTRDAKILHAETITQRQTGEDEHGSF